MTDSIPFGSASPTLERIKPRKKIGLNIDEVANKTDGNFIFSFGYPGSGKTTFQWMLMNYLMNEGPFRTEIRIPDRADGADWGGRKIINEWKSQWIEGRFPDPTASGESDVREIEVTAVTTAGKKLSVDFSFLEMSGELLQQVMPGASTSPKLSPLLSAYLGNPRLKFCVILMLSPDIEENDQLFASFITYLKKNFPGLINRMSLGVVVSKPEASLDRLRQYGATDGETGFAKFNGDALMAYMNRFCGETYQVWMDWPDESKTLLAPLHLGQVEQIDGEPRLVEPSFLHIEQIFFWIFRQFTNKSPGPTLWQRISGRLDWK